MILGVLRGSLEGPPLSHFFGFYKHRVHMLSLSVHKTYSKIMPASSSCFLFLRVEKSKKMLPALAVLPSQIGSPRLVAPKM